MLWKVCKIVFDSIIQCPDSYWTVSVSVKIPFLSLFCHWLEGLLMLGSRPLSAANRVSHSKISVSNPSYLSLTVPWMAGDSEIYNGWL